MSPSEVEALCKLMVQYELDTIRVGTVRITKKLHRVEHAPKQEQDAPMTLDEPIDDDVLFMQTREPRMTVDDLARMVPRPGEETEQ